MKIDEFLEHHGIPGMHWGKNGVGSKIGNIGTTSKSIIKTGVNSGKDHIKKIREASSPAAAHAAAKIYTKALVSRTSVKPLSTWMKEAGTMTKNNFIHPILTSKADKASKQAASTKDKLRRALVYQNTNDLKDINARTAALIAAGKAKK